MSGPLGTLGSKSRELLVARIKTVLSHKGLDLEQFPDVKEDTETLALLKNEVLSDPTGHRATQLKRVLVVKGYRVEPDADRSPIVALVGEYTTMSPVAFLGRHNGKAWIDDPNYRPPYSEQPTSTQGE